MADTHKIIRGPACDRLIVLLLWTPDDLSLASIRRAIADVQYESIEAYKAGDVALLDRED